MKIRNRSCKIAVLCCLITAVQILEGLPAVSAAVPRAEYLQEQTSFSTEGTPIDKLLKSRGWTAVEVNDQGGTIFIGVGSNLPLEQLQELQKHFQKLTFLSGSQVEQVPPSPAGVAEEYSLRVTYNQQTSGPIDYRTPQETETCRLYLLEASLCLVDPAGKVFLYKVKEDQAWEQVRHYFEQKPEPLGTTGVSAGKTPVITASLIREAYLTQPDSMTYQSIQSKKKISDLCKLFNSIVLKKREYQYAETSLSGSGFYFYQKPLKYQFNLEYSADQKCFLVVREHSNPLAKSTCYYLLSQQEEEAVKQAVEKALQAEDQQHYLIQWFAYMNMENVANTSIVVGNQPFTIEKTASTDLCHLFKNLPVENKVNRIQGKRALTENLAYRFLLDFHSGLTYDIIFTTDGKIRVQSSDRDFTLEYTIVPDTEVSTKLLETAANMEKTLASPYAGYLQKPNLYLYPEKETTVEIKLHSLENSHFLGYTDPIYQDGWTVTAHPDGKLIRQADEKEYGALFWEEWSDGPIQPDFSTGFVVKGNETEAFLREKLSYMGMTSQEIQDFVSYWVPKLSANPYNVLSFSQELYDGWAPVEISPLPDSILRIYMVSKGLDAPIDVKPQELKSFQRKGFTAVIWSGVQLPQTK